MAKKARGVDLSFPFGALAPAKGAGKGKGKGKKTAKGKRKPVGGGS